MQFVQLDILLCLFLLCMTHNVIFMSGNRGLKGFILGYALRVPLQLKGISYNVV